jgi:hypothetical protein
MTTLAVVIRYHPDINGHNEGGLRILKARFKGNQFPLTIACTATSKGGDWPAVLSDKLDINTTRTRSWTFMSQFSRGFPSCPRSITSSTFVQIRRSNMTCSDIRLYLYILKYKIEISRLVRRAIMKQQRQC